MRASANAHIPPARAPHGRNARAVRHRAPRSRAPFEGLRGRAVAAPDAAHDDATRAMSVQEYIEKHDLTKKIEEALNAAVKAKADEPLAFVVRATRRD